MQIDIRTDIAEGLKKLYALEPRQFPFVVALAMNRTISSMKPDMRKEMEQRYDRPTRYTLNSLMTKAATKQKLEAELRIKGDPDKGTPAAKYLDPTIRGGVRRKKRFERALEAAGILPSDMYCMPAKDAPLDGYGNVRGAYITRMLSYLRASSDPYQNRTARTSKAKPKQFFAISQPHPRFPMGIYERQSRGVKLIFIFTKAQHYKEMFDFYGKSALLAKERFPAELRKAAEYAMATSRNNSGLQGFVDFVSS